MATTRLPAFGHDYTEVLMHGLVIGLLTCFGLVVAGAVAMIWLHRRHLRAWRMSHPVAAMGGGGKPAPHPYSALPAPGRWVAIRSSNTLLVREILGVSPRGEPWSEALLRGAEQRLFVSGPVSGWTFVVGGALPDPSQDIDVVYRFLVGASRLLGEVQFFAMDRVVGHHAWARIRDGHVERGYAWAGGTEWNEGVVTLEERLLGLQCHAYGESLAVGWVGEATAEMENAERVPLLARRWGMDIAAATDILLHAEAVGSGENGDVV